MAVKMWGVAVAVVCRAPWFTLRSCARQLALCGVRDSSKVLSAAEAVGNSPTIENADCLPPSRTNRDPPVPRAPTSPLFEWSSQDWLSEPFFQSCQSVPIDLVEVFAFQPAPVRSEALSASAFAFLSSGEGFGGAGFAGISGGPCAGAAGPFS